MTYINPSDFVASIKLIPDFYSPCCGNSLIELEDGWLGRAWICETCDKIYKLELRQIPKDKIPKKFMEYAKNKKQ